MEDEDSSGRGDSPTRSEELDNSKLKVDGVANQAATVSPRKIMKDAARHRKPFRDCQDKLGQQMKSISTAQEAMEKSLGPYRDFQDMLGPQMKGISTAQEAMEKSLGPYRDLQERMKKLSLAAGDESPLKRLADKIGAQQTAIDAMRFPEPELPHIPEQLPMPPNPLLETNRRLERIEERFEQVQGIAADAAEIATGLQGAAAEFLQKFEKAATDNDRAAGRAIWIGIVAVFIAVTMPAAQIIYSEYRREPNNGAEVQATLEAVQTELATMRADQAVASDRLNDALATSGGETTAILRDIHGLLSRDAAPPPAADGE